MRCLRQNDSFHHAPALETHVLGRLHSRHPNLHWRCSRSMETLAQGGGAARDALHAAIAAVPGKILAQRQKLGRSRGRPAVPPAAEAAALERQEPSCLSKSGRRFTCP